MSMTGLDTFDTTVQQTNELLGKIEEEFDWQDRREQSYLALRTSLHLLRDRLPVNSAAQLAAQLPLLVKGVFYDGWDPSSVPVKMDAEEMVNSFQEKFIYSTEDIEEVFSKTLSIVLDSIARGQAETIQDILPEDIADMLK